MKQMFVNYNDIGESLCWNFHFFCGSEDEFTEPWAEFTGISDFMNNLNLEREHLYLGKYSIKQWTRPKQEITVIKVIKMNIHNMYPYFLPHKLTNYKLTSP
jgi:calcineurin-like phosphoesterase family protein